MAAVKYIGKWNYMKASEEDEDKFVNEEPDGDIQVADLKAAFALFQKTVCKPELPPSNTPAANLVNRAFAWLVYRIDDHREEDENFFKEELLTFIVKCFESGPNTSHIELIDHAMRASGVGEYLENLTGDGLRKFLASFCREFSYQDPETSVEDYADMLSNTVRMKIFASFESEQLQSVLDACASLYSYLESLDLPEPLASIYGDMMSTLERLCGSELKKKVHSLKPIVPWKVRIKQVEEAILKEPEMEEAKGSKLYDILQNGVDYLRENPDEYVSHFEDYMRVFAALSKCPDTKGVRKIMHAIDLVHCKKKLYFYRE